MRRGGEGGEKEGRDREMEKATSEKKKTPEDALSRD